MADFAILCGMREVDYFTEDLLYRSLRVLTKSGTDMRWGQCLFNTLCLTRKDLASKVACSPADPFHADNRIPAFLDWLSENYTDTGH